MNTWIPSNYANTSQMLLLYCFFIDCFLLPCIVVEIRLELQRKPVAWCCQLYPLTT